MTDIDRWIDDNSYVPTRGLWTRANMGEVLPDPPSPLGWDLVWEGSAVLGFRDCYVNRVGFGDDELHPTRPEIVGVFGGYAYLGVTVPRVWAARSPGFSPEMIDAAYFAGHPDIPPYVPEPWHDNPATGEVMQHWLWWVVVDRDQSELEADRVSARAARACRPDLATMTDAELFARAMSFKPVIRSMFDQHINQSAAAAVGPGVIGAVCAAVGRPTDTLRLLAGLGGVDSAEPAAALWELSRQVQASPAVAAHFDAGVDRLCERLRSDPAADVAAFVASIDEFLVEFGSRGPNEWDLRSPTWETSPDLVLVAVDRMRFCGDTDAPHVRSAEQGAERLRLGREISAMLAGDPETLGQFQAALASAATFVAGRERSKTNVIRVIQEVRTAVWELGRRAVGRGDLDEPRDICLLFTDELHDLTEGRLNGVRDLVHRRREHLRWLESIEPPFLFHTPPPPNTAWPERGIRRTTAGENGAVLTGIPGCAGIARGRARVVLDPADPATLEPGDVLVAPLTDPAWTPLFVPTAAVVVNVGAPLSHAVIVSRELGIPCVVSVTDATDRLPDGALVEVNGDLGTVTIIENPSRVPDRG